MTRRITWAGITGTQEDVPGGQVMLDAQCTPAAGDTSTSPSQTFGDARNTAAGGGQAAQPAQPATPPIGASRAGRPASRGQSRAGTQADSAPAAHPPAGQCPDGTQTTPACGAIRPPAPRQPATASTAEVSAAGRLADPLLAFAADILTDLEKVRIANENRLRQLTRSVEDADGELRGFGLDASHPDVARLAALVDLLGQAEHQAELNLGRRMRSHPLYPWVQASKGVGVKQAARLLASVGDPYMRPEITRDDGTTEPARPRKVSELWAFTGYHVIKVPAGSQTTGGPQRLSAAGGEDTRTSHTTHGSQDAAAGAGQTATPATHHADTQRVAAGVAPRRQRGVRANWSSAAKMRAFLVAESCIKQLDGGYRAVYDAARARYADAVHEVACVRCGPRGTPAPPGSPLSDGHKHGRGLRAVAKQVLKDLWREARAVHDPTGSQSKIGPQTDHAAGGPHTATSSHADRATRDNSAAGGGTPVTGSQNTNATRVAIAAGDPPSAASSQRAIGTRGRPAAGSPPPATGGHSASDVQSATAAGGGPPTPTSQGAE